MGSTCQRQRDKKEEMDDSSMKESGTEETVRQYQEVLLTYHGEKIRGL